MTVMSHTPVIVLLFTALMLAGACSSSDANLESSAQAVETDADGDSEDPAEASSEAADADEADSDEVDSDEAAPDAATAEAEDTQATDAAGSDTVTQAVDAANALIALLSADEIDTLSYDYGDSTIATSWSNLPACDTNGRAGIRHGDLTDQQLAAVMAVVDSVLSDEGYLEYEQIIAADEELGGGNGGVWDADCYYLAIYGTPSTTDEWGLQFGGHHYARTVTFSGGDVTVTPAFTGVEPRSFTLDGETVEPLRDEGEAILAIFESLSDDEIGSAELGGRIDEVQLGPGSDSFPATEGLLVSELSDESTALVLAAIRTWVDDFDPAAADVIMTEIEAELDETAIGWANSIDFDIEGTYGRIDGPSVWIEFVNEGGVGGNDVHQHSVYRDRSSDYGTAA